MPNFFSDFLTQLAACEFCGPKTVKLDENGLVGLPVNSAGVELTPGKRSASKNNKRGITIESVVSSNKLTLTENQSFQTDVTVDLGDGSEPKTYTSIAYVGTGEDETKKYQAYLNSIEIYSVIAIDGKNYGDIFNTYGVVDESLPAEQRNLYLLHSSPLVEKGTKLTGAANSDGKAAVPIDIPDLKVLDPSTGLFVDPSGDDVVGSFWKETVSPTLKLAKGSSFTSPAVNIKDSKGNSVILNLRVKTTA